MQIALWIVDGLLALIFLAAGGMKAFRPKEALATSGLAWVEDFSARSVKLVGVAEVLGAVGLLVPRFTGIVPALTPAASICLLVLMAGAVVTHLRRRENPIAPIVLGALLAISAVLGFILLGR